MNYRKRDLGRRSHGTKRMKPATIRIDNPDILFHEIEMRAKEIDENRKRLSQYSEYLEIYYEDFFQKSHGQSGQIAPEILDIIFDFLHIEDRKYDLRTDLKKTNPDDLCEIIENYEEVAAALRKTKWRRFLE